MTDRELLEKMFDKLVALEKKVDNLPTREEVNKGFSDVMAMITVTQKHLQDHEHTLKLVTK